MQASAPTDNTIRPQADLPFAAASDRLAGPARLPIPWPLIYALAALLFLVWLSPPFHVLKLSTGVMPVWVHSLFEMVAVVVALLSFTIAWHAHDAKRPANILILGCGLLAVGIIDAAHLMSYRGMPDWVTPASPEKSINFWLCARYIGALTLMAIAIREWKPVSYLQRSLLLAGSIGLALAVLYLELYHHERWPRTFIEGLGLTPFKVAAEYGVVALLLVPATLFYRQRGSGDYAYDSSGLFTATIVTILSELCFTLYLNVNEIFSLLGHAYKIVAFVFIYRAVFMVSVREPYKLLEQEVKVRATAEAEVRHRIYHDPLTDLPNRLLVEEQVRKLFSKGQGNARLALLSVDVDHFQALNDVLGVGVGDDLLRQVAHRLLAASGRDALVSRFSGDAFLILLDGAADEAAVTPVLEAIMAAMRRPFAGAGQQTMQLTVSVGIAFGPRDGEDFDTLHRNADTAMYRAKHAGRQTWRFFNLEMDAREQERKRLFGLIREAIDQQQFRLCYQPQVDVVSGRVTGFEALVRWNHPILGEIPPDRFIQVAEDTGLIQEIGHWVLMQSCQQMADWRFAGWAGLSLAVNVSAAQFRNQQLEKSVAAALAQSGLPPSQLELEMTESVLMRDSEHVLESARALRRMGARLAIDDFGTGYSSLSYLKRFAVSRLKIDRSFVADITSDPDDAAIVRAIIDMARSLRLTTIAEGVEDEATLAALRKLGCDEAQGFLFARAMPAEEVPGFLRALQPALISAPAAAAPRQ